MQAHVLSRRQTKAHKVVIDDAVDVSSVLNQALQFGEGLLDLGNCTRAIDELPVWPGRLLFVVLVSDDERQQRDCFAGP